MADKIQTTAPEDGSKKPAQTGPTPPVSPAPESPEPEPVIIEEVVIKPAPTKTPKPAKPAPAPLTTPTQESGEAKAPEPTGATLPTKPPAPTPAPTPGPVPSEPAEAPRPEVSKSPLSPTTLPPPTPPLPPLPPQSPKGPESPAGAALAEAPESQKEREAIAHILEEVKLPERRPLPDEPAEQKGLNIFDTKLGATAESLEPKKQEMLPPLPAPQSKGLEFPIVSPLRTLKKDLQEIIQVKKISLVRAVALEQEKRRGRTETSEVTEGRTRRTRGILFAVALLLSVGGAALFGVYLVMPESSQTQKDPSTSILFAENTVSLLLTNTSPLELKRLLSQARAGGSATLGSITRVVPLITEPGAGTESLERTATLEEFLSALGTRASADLTRALRSDFFFGIHTVDENAPLFVIPVLSYERAFAGMLEWEETLNADLLPAFTSLPPQVVGGGGLPEKRRFEDVVMRNYDVRALKDDRGEIQLYYSFPTRELLVIGESPYSFTEILSRLRAERKL